MEIRDKFHSREMQSMMGEQSQQQHNSGTSYRCA